MKRYIRKSSEAKPQGEKYRLEDLFIWTPGLWDRGDMVDVPHSDIIFPPGKSPSEQPDSPEDYIHVPETPPDVSPNVVVQDVTEGSEKKAPEAEKKEPVQITPDPKAAEEAPKVDPDAVDPNRITLLKQAMETLMPEDFIPATTNYSTKPSTVALTEILGFEVFSKERDVAWDQVKGQFPEISSARGKAKAKK